MTQDEMFAEHEERTANKNEETEGVETPLETLVETQEETEVDAIQEFLAAKGIQNKTIQFEEEGEVVNKEWHTLKGSEQLQILKDLYTDEPKEEYAWSKDDNDIIAYAKENKLSLSDIIANEVSRINQEVQPIQSVSTLSDDDIFTQDLVNRVGKVDDEYLKEAIEKAKEDKFYTQKIESIRNDFEAVENSIKKNEEDKIYQEQVEEYNQQVNTINTNIEEIDDMYGFEVDQETKSILSEQLTQLNDSGETVFTEWVNKPENAIKALWFANYGEKAFQTMQEHYIQEVANAEKLGYDKATKEFDNQVNRLPTKPIRQTNTTDKVVDNTKDKLTVEDLHNNYSYK